jgi:hypothetical protein
MSPVAITNPADRVAMSLPVGWVGDGLLPDKRRLEAWWKPGKAASGSSFFRVGHAAGLSKAVGRASLGLGGPISAPGDPAGLAPVRVEHEHGDDAGGQSMPLGPPKGIVRATHAAAPLRQLLGSLLCREQQRELDAQRPDRAGILLLTTQERCTITFRDCTARSGVEGLHPSVVAHPRCWATSASITDIILPSDSMRPSSYFSAAILNICCCPLKTGHDLPV